MEDPPAPREPVVANVADAQTRKMVVGMVVAGFFGVAAIVGAITGNVTGGTGVRIAAFVIGLLFTLIGALPLLLWRVAFRPRRLVIDADGMRWDDPNGVPWAVEWPELATVRLLNQEPDLGRTKAMTVTSPLEVRLYPASRDFRDAHPEMEHLATDSRGGPGVFYRLPLGHSHRLVGPIHEGLAAFGPGVYTSKNRLAPAPARPPAVAASVALLALCWLFPIAAAALGGDMDAKGLAMAAGWTAAVALWLVRIWLGGPLATGQMARFAPVLGTVIAGGIVLIVVGVGMSTGNPPDPSGALVVLPGVLFGAALIVAGRLLARDDVEEWSRAHGQGR